MKRLLRALSVVSFVCFLAAATAALFFRARAEAGPPAQAVQNAPNIPNAPPVSGDAGVDAGSTVAAVFGSGGSGHYLPASKSFGGAPLAPDGFGGLGLRGAGTDGGLGIGGLSGADTLGGEASTAAEAVVMGSLDKELIRKVIRAHREEIRACYEKALLASPKLSGKVAVKFVVTATGAVTSSTVAQSTVANPDLEKCAAQAVETWKFPAPKGGGVVVVTYPFIFQPAAQK